MALHHLAGTSRKSDGSMDGLLDTWTSSPVSGGHQGSELAHSSDGTSGGTHGQSHEHIQGQSNEHAPQFTSRISMKHVVDTVAGFTEFKRWLINEIGFGGMLNLPMLQKLNLKFSAWIMGRVDVTARAICISETNTLRFWAEDIHKVFGIPCGNRDVRGRDGNITQQLVDFLKMSLGMDRAGAHSLRAAEEFLRRDITEDSSKVEKDCFQIAFVIFVMGHLLAPSTKYDYCQIDFWGAVVNTEHIAQFNWCEYVLKVLLDAITKLQKDTMNKNATMNMFGCHIFLPVFMLDNLDLGIFTTKHDVIPRIISFDQVTFRRMTTMASDVRTTPPSYQSVMGISPT
uniref:Uncharacterized protein n=2 Tax=Avena sativa TaxID=4498 RepID=A0ACD5UEM7_AVESA